MQMTKTEKTYKGYTLSRGAYSGTTDDRLDRWYIDRIESYDSDGVRSNIQDRRGPGYRTQREAKDAINEIERGQKKVEPGWECWADFVSIQ